MLRTAAMKLAEILLSLVDFEILTSVLVAWGQLVRLVVRRRLLLEFCGISFIRFLIQSTSQSKFLPISMSATAVMLLMSTISLCA